VTCTAKGAAVAPKSTSAPWQRPNRFGYPETLRGLGGVVAPLLTGFSLATIALLLTSASKPKLADWAVVAFAAAVGFFLLAMQIAFLALARSPSPADIHTWQPEITISAAALQSAREEQAANMHDVKRLWDICRRGYDLGILAFLAGVVLLLIPDDWSGVRIVGVVVAGLALLGELWWTLANQFDFVPHPLVRDSDPADFKDKILPLDATGQAAVLGAAHTATSPEKGVAKSPLASAQLRRVCQRIQRLAVGKGKRSSDKPPATKSAGTDKNDEDADADCPEDPCVKVPGYIYTASIAWIIALIAAFVLFERWDWFADAVQFKLGQLPFEAIWFGALGGLLVSLQGIFDYNRKWRDSYNYWHIIRPVLGAIMGTLGCLIFIVLTEAATKEPSPVKPVFYDVIALAIGYREASFRALLKRLLDTIILPPPPEEEKSKEKGAARRTAGTAAVKK
jgi:hypothetical protein